MCAWRLAIRHLYGLGGSATFSKLDDGSIYSLRSALDTLKHIGLVSYIKKSDKNSGEYALTELGWLWCEGRVAVTWHRGTAEHRRGRGLMATWLRAFPGRVPLLSNPQLSLF